MTALYLFGAFLVVLLAGVVLAPLVEREPPEEELDELPPEERHEAAVEALAELEFEYRTDKLAEEEYRQLRSHYGRIALAAEEAMEGEGGAAEDARRGEGVDASDGAEASTGGARPGPAEPTSQRTCPACGSEAPEGARFCPRCGERLRDGHEEA